MSNQTLRELAKDYAKGAIDKETYRKSRTELVTAIISGQVTVKANTYEPPLAPVEEDLEVTVTSQKERDITAFADENTKQPSSQNPVSAQTDKKSPLVFILVSVVIVISLIIAVFLFYPRPPGSVPTTPAVPAPEQISMAPTNTEQSDNDVVMTTNMAGESLIADFLTEKNWNEESLDSFLESWQTLSMEEQESAKQTKRMQRMHDSIYKQFLEEKALASIDNEKALMKQQKLIEFATAIGIIDPRLAID